MVQFFRNLWSDEQGQDIAEYAVMLAVILVLVIGTVRLIGSNANNVSPEYYSRSLRRSIWQAKVQHILWNDSATSASLAAIGLVLRRRCRIGATQ